MDFSITTMYDWVAFFSELSLKIDELNENPDRDFQLFNYAQQSFGEDAAICKYEYVDPFSFIYFLAQRNTVNQHIPVFSKVKEAFSLESEIPTDMVFPTPTPNSTTLYHDGKTYNNDILWEMFHKACSGDALSNDLFDKCLNLKSVGCSKLTQTLFLINPEIFLPIDKRTSVLFSTSGIDNPENIVINSSSDGYHKLLDIVKKRFVGCSFWEINRLAYAIASEGIIPNFDDNWIQLSSHRDNDGKDHIDDWISQNIIELGYTDGDPYEKFVKLKPGDIVIVKKGMSEFHGLAMILEDVLISKAGNWPSQRSVIWILKQKATGMSGFARGSIGTTNKAEIYGSMESLFSDFWKFIASFGTGKNQETKIDNYKEVEAMKDYSKNLIFYGPPGTGKTYETVSLAAEIIEDRVIENYSDALEIFNNNLGSRIEFITFHQNYSYEDFIQGLRPDTDNSDSLNFERKDGVFHRIATNALFEYYKAAQKGNVQHEELKDKKIGEIYLDFFEYLKQLENKTFKTINNAEVQIHELNKNKNISLRHGQRNKTYVVSAKRLMKLFAAYPEIEDIKNINNDIRDVIGGCNATMYWVILKEFIRFYNDYTLEVDEDFSPEENLEEIEYEVKKEILSTFDLADTADIDQSQIKKYVIIIDEINRANISRVFGELITLIEPDKRSHGEIPLRCTLPSGEEFIVPSNLYIIGTMNTADKSIALLDIALRRRFVFVPMYPKYEIEGYDIHDTEILKVINEQILQRKGHDFQIGHSYFMGNNYDRIFNLNNKVIPLLLEYFMNDEEEVKEILKAADLQVKEDSWPIEIE